MSFAEDIPHNNIPYRRDSTIWECGLDSTGEYVCQCRPLNDHLHPGCYAGDWRYCEDEDDD